MTHEGIKDERTPAGTMAQRVDPKAANQGPQPTHAIMQDAPAPHGVLSFRNAEAAVHMIKKSGCWRPRRVVNPTHAVHFRYPSISILEHVEDRLPGYISSCWRVNYGA